MRKILGFIILWVSLGVPGIGWNVAYFQGKYPSISKEMYKENLSFSIFYGLILGPVGSLLSFMLTDFGEYGWKLK